MYVVFAFLVLAALIGFEWQLVNGPAGKEALQRIRGDARVRAEFGDDVHIRYAVGWGFINRAWLYGSLIGKQAHGHAVVDLRPIRGQWKVVGLEVHNDGEGHLINLAAPETPAKLDQLQAPGTLYFVALGERTGDDVKELANIFETEFKITSRTLPAMALPEEAYDAGRKQWVSELLTQAIEAQYPEIAADPDAAIVGVLDQDQYIRNFNWPFTFNYRSNSRYSVISSFRLDPAFEQFPASPAIRMERLRKVAMKSVALMHLGFQESFDPHSVDAFEGSVEDIDRMGSVYLESDVGSRSRTDGTEDSQGSPCLTFFTTHVAGAPQRKPIQPCWQRSDTAENSQYQINLALGQFQLTRNDFYRPGMVPLRLQRMFFSHHFNEQVRAFGKSTWQNLDDTVWSADPGKIQEIIINGATFQRVTPGSGFSPSAKYRAGPMNGGFSYALLTWENGGWRVDTRGEGVWRYLGCTPDTRVQCYYVGTTSPAVDTLEVRRDLTTGHIQQVVQKTNPNLPLAAAHDHVLTPTYEGERIVRIADSDGRSAHYRYDAQEFLTDVEADGHTVHYDYDDAYRLIGVSEDGVRLRVRYDAEGRPGRVDFPNGSGYGIQYLGDTIKVDGPTGKYSVKVTPTYFQTVKEK